MFCKLWNLFFHIYFLNVCISLNIKHKKPKVFTSYSLDICAGNGVLEF